MNKYKIFNRSAKILTVVFIIFLGLFAFDVFEEKAPWYMLLTSLLIHLIPNFILIIVALIAWRQAKAGGIIFLILGIVYLGILLVLFGFGKGTFDLSSLIIASPLFLIGFLFLLSAKYKNNL